MNLTEKYKELIILIHKFLDKQVEASDLSHFAWEIISFFSTTQSVNLPNDEEFEPEFWHAIWQIQHLTGESDVSLMKNQIQMSLDYLEGTKILPNEYAGYRP
jgi:hypothetical protein